MMQFIWCLFRNHYQSNPKHAFIGVILAKLKADVFPRRASMSVINEEWFKFKMLTIHLPFLPIASICLAIRLYQRIDRFSCPDCHCKWITMAYNTAIVNGRSTKRSEQKWKMNPAQFRYPQQAKRDHRNKVNFQLRRKSFLLPERYSVHEIHVTSRRSFKSSITFNTIMPLIY